MTITFMSLSPFSFVFDSKLSRFADTKQIVIGVTEEIRVNLKIYSTQNIQRNCCGGGWYCMVKKHRNNSQIHFMHQTTPLSHTKKVERFYIKYKNLVA